MKAGGRWKLRDVVARLRRAHGAAPAPPTTDPFGLVLWESVAYLANDRERAAAFARLQSRTGLSPKRLLAASPETLAACVAAPGRFAALQAEKLRACAEIVVRDFGGALDAAIALPAPAAIRALRTFPAIGKPGAERILMLAGKLRELAPESNGLRVLVRLGFGEEHRDYRRTYESARAAVAGEIPAKAPWLAEAHQLLRFHGQTVCKNTQPRCGDCPLHERCPSAS